MYTGAVCAPCTNSLLPACAVCRVEGEVEGGVTRLEGTRARPRHQPLSGSLLLTPAQPLSPLIMCWSLVRCPPAPGLQPRQTIRWKTRKPWASQLVPGSSVHIWCWSVFRSGRAGRGSGAKWTMDGWEQEGHQHQHQHCSTGELVLNLDQHQEVLSIFKIPLFQTALIIKLPWYESQEIFFRQTYFPSFWCDISCI